MNVSSNRSVALLGNGGEASDIDPKDGIDWLAERDQAKRWLAEGEIEVGGRTVRLADGREVLNFCANNYLGLADDESLVAAANEAMATYGYGMASVRFICGTLDLHKQLEQKKVLGAQKLQMTHVQADVSETENLLKHDAKITMKSSQWVINLSASVRPVMSYLFFIEFFGLSIAVNAKFITTEQYAAIWNDPTQALFATVVSFWFGSRTFNRNNHT